MQLHQLMDACLFALSFWLAYEARSMGFIVARFGGAAPFEEFVWFYLVLIPAAPLVLETQGFYHGRCWTARTVALAPGQVPFMTSAGGILFLFKIEPPRRDDWFSAIAFALVWSRRVDAPGLLQRDGPGSIGATHSGRRRK
jgi:hypothetical protein